MIINNNILEKVEEEDIINGRFEFPENITIIGKHAFEDCQSLTDIEIPNSVTQIERMAFFECDKLVTIKIPYGLKKIEDSVFSGCSSLKELIIPESVTQIGEFAFGGCQSLTDIEIPNSVTQIGKNAFCECNKLTIIRIPYSLEKIEDGVFSWCSSLKELIIPENVTRIGKQAFKGCESLTTITIPESVEYIEYEAFQYCENLTNIKIQSDNTRIASDSFYGCDYAVITQGKKLVHVGMDIDSEEFIVPEEIEEIGEGAFGRSANLKSIKILGKIKKIEFLTFTECHKLESIVLPETLEEIGANAFESCQNLENIQLPKGITKIGEEAFSGCHNLESIELPDSLEEIDERAFENCYSLNDIVIPDNVHRLGKYVFCNCFNLENVKLPKSIKKIETGLFSSCGNLVSIELPKELTEIEENAFEYCEKLTHIEIPDGVTAIEEQTFLNCINLENVEFLGSLTEIGKGAFEDCEKLTSIKIPEKVRKIEDNAFKNCRNLVMLELSEKLEEIANSAFENCEKLTSIKIPEKVRKIGDNAFKNCRNLVMLELPEKLEEIANSAFENCEKAIITRGTELYKVGIAVTDKILDIPEYVTCIRDGVFQYCEDLKNVVLPERIEEIGSYAFSYCTFLENIKIPKGVKKINHGTFLYCSRLVNIDFPDNLTYISYYAFKSCMSLTSIKIPNGVTEIKEGAFEDCTNLTSIELPNQLTCIDKRTFNNCTRLISVELPENLKEIDSKAFFGCKHLKNIKIPDNVTSIGEAAFSRCTSLTNVKIPDSVTEIGRYVFSLCTNLTSIEIPENVKKIDEKSFSGCTFLKSIKLNRSFENFFNDEENNLILKIGEKDTLEDVEKILNDIDNYKGIFDFISKIKIGDKGKTVNNIFRYSNYYNYRDGLKYIIYIRDILGIDALEKLLVIPETLTEEEFSKDPEKLKHAYQIKYKLKGKIPTIIEILEELKKNKDRNSLEKLNIILETNENKNINETLKELGIENSRILKLIGTVKNKELNKKSKTIKEKINENIISVEFNDLQPRGVIEKLVYKVIRDVYLSDGKKADIELALENRLNKPGRNAGLYYGEGIQNKKARIKELIEKVYADNPELVDKTIFEEIREVKNEVGDKWIIRLLKSKKGVKNIWNMTEEEKEKFERGLEKQGIKTNTEYNKNYERRQNVDEGEVYRILQQANIEKLLTYEKAEMMFANMQEPYSKRFTKWFMRHREEIMNDSNYYTKIGNMHNEFERILNYRATRQAYENETLTVEGALNILNGLENELEGELGRLTREYGITNKKELEEIKQIFEITRKREKSYIPQVSNKKDKYVGRILRADDPMNILVGNATNCCQKVGDRAGQGSMEHGSKDNAGRIFVIEELDEQGKVKRIVAQSWVWRVGDRVCFDNVEVPEKYKQILKYENGDIEAQKSVIEIYKKCAEEVIKRDKKQFDILLKNKRITQEQYDELVLKDVTIGTGLNDLGILKKSGLEKAKVEILPERKYENMWIDSGGNDGEQLVLAKSKIERKANKKGYKIEELPLLYRNFRERKKVKGIEIDDEIIKEIKIIENLVYRDEQKLIQDAQNYVELAKIYEVIPDNMEVQISREKDWYMVYEERPKEIYIADLAMKNGLYSQNRKKGDFVGATLEMEEALVSLMKESARKGKKVKINATEDTSYKIVKEAIRKGIIKVLKDNRTNWNNNTEIIMHDMTFEVDKEKIEEELKKIEKIKELRKDRVELPEEFKEISI